jgi:hypothetical protein
MYLVITSGYDCFPKTSKKEGISFIEVTLSKEGGGEGDLNEGSYHIQKICCNTYVYFALKAVDTLHSART